MKSAKILFSVSIGSCVIFMSAACIAGTTYRFTVACKDRRQVVEWGVGDIDPGKEYLRAQTGTKFPGCQIADYNDARDHSLPRDRYSAEGGVIQGIPVVGPLLDKLFHW